MSSSRMVYSVEVEGPVAATDETPSVGGVRRCIYAKDGLTDAPHGVESPWQLFSESVERNPGNPMLGRRNITDGKAGPYVWLTYQEVYDSAIQIGSAIRKCGVNPGDHCGIYGSNCPEWIIVMEGCNSQAITYIPFYDTLGNNAIEFIINHAEVSIAFVQENKLRAMINCLPRCTSYLKTIVSFGNITVQQKKEAEELGVSCFSWEEFSQLGTVDCQLPLKQVTDVCTIMYTSGTTDDCLTESCLNVFSMVGTVGVPITTIEARLESVPEMGYNALSSIPRGEICLRGNTLFSCYFKRQDLTEEVLVDGWFRTGDIGEWQPDGTMKIIDRKKNIFKLSQGEYVAMENLENIYSRCPLITSIWVYGNSFESFLVAVVVPERKALEDWASNEHQTGDFSSLCRNAEARRYMQDELNATGQKLKLQGFEMLRSVYLEPIPFDFERNLITPTFKLKRPQLLRYYKEVVDKMYREAKDTRA